MHPTKFDIPPRNRKRIRVVYSPDDIEKTERMGLEFKSEKLGEFQYECKGKGCLPTAMKPLELALPQDAESDFSVTFKNPFSETVNVNLYLEQSEDQDVFIFKQNTKLNHQLEAFNKLEIYLKFRPPKFGKYECSVSVQIGSTLKWVFPVIVETECDMTPFTKCYKIKTKSDLPLQQRLSFCLFGVEGSNSPDEGNNPTPDAKSPHEDQGPFMEGLKISHVSKHAPDFRDLSQLNLNTDQSPKTQAFKRDNLRAESIYENHSKKSFMNLENVPQKQSLLSFIKDKKSPLHGKLKTIAQESQADSFRDRDLSNFSESESEIASENSLIKKENIFFDLKLEDSTFEDLVSNWWLSIEKTETKIETKGNVYDDNQHHNTFYSNARNSTHRNTITGVRNSRTRRSQNNKMFENHLFGQVGPYGQQKNSENETQTRGLATQGYSNLSRFQHIDFLFDLHPKKPFTCAGTFTVSLANGGRWKYAVQFDVGEPKYYDTLNIVTCLNVKKGVQFRVFNCGRGKSFRAFFKENSDAGFGISPVSGDLLNHSANGTLFTVTFLPKEYGKTRKARLVIETSDRYYLFLIRGKFKKYSPPNK